MKKTILFFLFGLAFYSCTKETFVSVEKIAEEEENTCSRLKIDSSRIITSEEKMYLRAGPGEHEVFDITNSDIELCKLNQGIGREFFPALYEPEYESINNFFYSNDMDCIVLRDEGEIKIYPYIILATHETVNELVNEEPVMIVYCLLADLAAVYSRTYCGQTFTFAPSGFTYADDDYWEGVEGFLLWDRETESLWWPLSDKGVSGKMQDIPIKHAPISIWEQMTWGDVKKNFPNAITLSHTQNIVIPQLPKYSTDELDCK